MSKDIDHLTSQFTRIATTLSSIETRVAALHGEALPHRPTAPTPLQRAKEYYRKRRLRERMFGNPDLFADPAWDILIDLFIASEEGRKISVSSACIASAVPTTTALRWIKILEDNGHILRYQDPSDARRVFMSLSEPSVDKVREFFTD